MRPGRSILKGAHPRQQQLQCTFRVVDAGTGVGIVPMEIIRGRYCVDGLITVPLDGSSARRELVMGVREYK